MNAHIRFFHAIVILALAACAFGPARAASGHLLNPDVQSARQALDTGSPGAKALGAKAHGILALAVLHDVHDRRHQRFGVQ